MNLESLFWWTRFRARRYLHEGGAFGAGVVIAIAIALFLFHPLGEFVHYIEFGLFLAAVFILIIGRLLRSKQLSPMGIVTLERMLAPPIPPAPSAFRFRKPTSSKELKPFVELSDGEVLIAERHPELRREKRHQIYKLWFDRCPDAFLILERADRLLFWRYWRCVGVSIVLPLAEATYRDIEKSAIKIVELAPSQIAASQSNYMLVDTWIMPPKYKARHTHRIVREEHELHAVGLLFLHLSRFWNRQAEQQNVILVEADEPKVSRLCKELGFDETLRTKDNVVLQRLQYSNDPRNPKLLNYRNCLTRNVIAAFGWPIVGGLTAEERKVNSAAIAISHTLKGLLGFGVSALFLLIFQQIGEFLTATLGFQWHNYRPWLLYLGVPVVGVFGAMLLGLGPAGAGGFGAGFLVLAAAYAFASTLPTDAQGSVWLFFILLLGFVISGLLGGWFTRPPLRRPAVCCFGIAGIIASLIFFEFPGIHPAVSGQISLSALPAEFREIVAMNENGWGALTYYLPFLVANLVGGGAFGLWFAHRLQSDGPR